MPLRTLDHLSSAAALSSAGHVVNSAACSRNWCPAVLSLQRTSIASAWRTTGLGARAKWPALSTAQRLTSIRSIVLMFEVSSIGDSVGIASHTMRGSTTSKVLVRVRARKAAPVDPFEDPVAQLSSGPGGRGNLEPGETSNLGHMVSSAWRSAAACWCENRAGERLESSTKRGTLSASVLKEAA